MKRLVICLLLVGCGGDDGGSNGSIAVDNLGMALALASCGLQFGCCTDAEIMDAKAWIDRIGIGCEPASAASLAGVRKLVADGEIARDATVVCVLTGNVLKDTDAITAYHLDGTPDVNRYANPPVSIPATMDALRRVVDDAIHG